jgi:hypothetical protein
MAPELLLTMPNYATVVGTTSSLPLLLTGKRVLSPTYKMQAWHHRRALVASCADEPLPAPDEVMYVRQIRSG